MTCLSSMSDNISELLMLIIKFTTYRHRILLKNLRHIDMHNYVPQDLPVKDFSELIGTAISEHTTRQRLVLYDTDTIQFNPGGDIQIRPQEDPLASRLHRKDRNAYRSYINEKLRENRLNQNIAVQLLKDKEHKVLWIQEEPHSRMECNVR